jgi:hypothetical protein
VFRIRLGVVAALAAAAAFAGCRYSYSNPAEQLQAGQIAGRTVADPAAAGDTHPTGGIAVSLKGSSFDQVTHATGRFTILPLPPGTHTLLFRRGTQLALTRRVLVQLGSDGQPDGVSLGDVDVPFAGVIEGSLDDLHHTGVVVDELTGVTGPASWRYHIAGVAVGDHVLKFGLTSPGEGKTWVGGPLAITLGDEAQSSVTQAALVVVHEATGTGRLRLRVVPLLDTIAPPDVQITVEDYVHGPIPTPPVADAHGLVDVVLPEGVYRITIAPPPAHAGEVTSPQPATAVVLTGEVADAGSLYLVPPGLPRTAQSTCQEAADCDGRPCAQGSCGVNWAPAPVAPASLPYCTVTSECFVPWDCVAPGGLGGTCMDVGQGPTNGVCVACDTQCTPDGIALLQAPPAGPISPTGRCGP